MSKRVEVDVILNNQQAIVQLMKQVQGSEKAAQATKVLGTVMNSLNKTFAESVKYNSQLTKEEMQQFQAQQKLVQQTQKLQKETQGQTRAQGRLSESILHGVGSFYLINTAMQRTSEFMRAGVKDAMDLEHSMSMLQLTTSANSKEMEAYKELIQKTAIELGPINATDIFQGSRLLRNVQGMTNQKLYDMIPFYAKIVSASIDMSGGRASADQLYEYLKDITATSGGVKDVGYTKALLSGLFGGITQFAQGDPIGLLHGIRGGLPILKGLDLPPDQIAVLAALRYMQPLTGTAGSGREIGQFFAKFTELGSQLNKTQGGLSKKRAAFAKLLGDSTDLSGVQTDGRLDIFKIADRLAKVTEQYRSRGPEGRADFMALLKGAFGGELATKFGSVFIENVDLLKQIRDQIKGSLSPDQISKHLSNLARTQAQQLEENLQTVRANLYSDSLGKLKGVMQIANSFISGYNQLYQRHSPPHTSGSYARGLTDFAGIALPGGTALAALGTMSQSIPAFAGLGRLLVSLGSATAIGGAIALVISAAIVYYKHSKEINAAIKALRDAIVMTVANAIVGVISDLPMMMANKMGEVLGASPTWASDLAAKQAGWWATGSAWLAKMIGSNKGPGYDTTGAQSWAEFWRRQQSKYKNMSMDTRADVVEDSLPFADGKGGDTRDIASPTAVEPAKRRITPAHKVGAQAVTRRKIHEVLGDAVHGMVQSNDPAGLLADGNRIP